MHHVGLYQLLCSRQLLRREALQHLEPLGGLLDHGAKRGSDLDAHHAGPGDAHAQRVLDDVSGQLEPHVGGVGAQLLGRKRDGKRHGHGLGAPLGRNDLLLEEPDVVDHVDPPSLGGQLYQRLKRRLINIRRFGYILKHNVLVDGEWTLSSRRPCGMAQHGRGVVTLLAVLCVCRGIDAAGLGARGVTVLLGGVKTSSQMSYSSILRNILDLCKIENLGRTRR